MASLDIPHRWLAEHAAVFAIELAEAFIADLEGGAGRVQPIHEHAFPRRMQPQLFLIWLLAQKPWIVPIPGTSKIDYLNENLGAINVQLTPADLREIKTALSKITVHGGRMNAEQMKVVDQTA